MVFTLVDGVVGMAALLLFVAAILGILAVLAEGFAGMLTHLSLGLPGFASAQSGNALYDTYGQLRWAAIIMLAGAASAYAALGRWRAGLRRAAPLMILLFVFPYAWDYGAHLSYMAGAWVLNPLYTLDPESPCPAGWDYTHITQRYEASPYHTGGDPYMLCRPELRVAYVVEQAAGTTTIQADDHIMGFVAQSIPAGLAEIFVNMFGALTKAFTIINLTLAAAAAGVIFDVYAGLVVGAMPVWIILYMVPRLDGLSARFLASIPAILLAPPLTSLVVVMGSSALVSTPQGGPAAILGVWVGAVSILFLAVLLPAAIIPAVRGVMDMSTAVLASGASASAGVMARTAGGAVSAIPGGRAGMVRGGLEGLATGHIKAYGR